MTILTQTLDFQVNSEINLERAEKLVGQSKDFPVRENGKTRYEKREITSLKDGLKFLVAGKNNKNKNKFWKTSNDIIQTLSNGWTYRGCVKTGSTIDTIQSISIISLDFERVGGGTQLEDSESTFKQYAIARYRTSSYTENDQRHRLVFVLDRSVNVEEFKKVLQVIYDKYPDEVLDKSCSDPGRLYFPGTGLEVFDKNARIPVDSFLEAYNAIYETEDDSFYQGKMNLGETLQNNTSGEITSRIDTYIIQELFYKNDSDINKLFCLYPHDLKEVKPDTSDCVSKWVGNNPFTDNKSGESFCVSQLNNGRIVWKARGSEFGGNLLNYFFSMFKFTENLFKKDDKLEGKNFRDCFNKIVERTGIKFPEFFNKKSDSSKKKGGIAQEYEQFKELIGSDITKCELTDRIYFKGEYDPDRDFYSPLLYSENYGYEFSYNTPGKTKDFVRKLANENKFHPIKDYLEEVYEKYKDQLDHELFNNISSRFFGTDKDIYNTYMAKTLIGAVGRVYQPGIEIHSVTVLHGRQGVGKTRFWKELSNKDWFCDSIDFETNSRDELLKLRSSWFVELGELASIFGKKKIEDMRKFIERGTDKYREPYAVDSKEYKRRSILVGTVNEDDFLNDKEGDRRYWVIPLNVKSVDFKLLKEVKDMLWAVAYHYWKQAESTENPADILHLSEEEAIFREEINSEFRSESPYKENIIPVITEKYESITVSQIWEDILKMSFKLPNKKDEMEITAILKQEGWIKKRITYQGYKYTVWINPNANDLKNPLDFRYLADRKNLSGTDQDF